ncbi:centromere-associated protein E isoform X1 [Iris pallida]|uniref:Centromere-associated protein E isoform X1 n=1 Tax=Iris pallida TaxID=29817 RepID=A0AAX6IIR1_IRIPA|nr:centromere-associated protein E isoform X1 [Iris pallida]
MNSLRNLETEQIVQNQDAVYGLGVNKEWTWCSMEMVKDDDGDCPIFYGAYEGDIEEPEEHLAQ